MLRERQENQETSDHMEECPLQENISRCMALREGKKLGGKVGEWLCTAACVLFRMNPPAPGYMMDALNKEEEFQ